MGVFNSFTYKFCLLYFIIYYLSAISFIDQFRVVASKLNFYSSQFIKNG